LNAFNPRLRRVAVETLSDIARQCDGVRCDMAMLLMNSVFERTWGARVGQRPSTDYWREVIPSINVLHPDFLFIAEAYWDLEWELQQQGFDFCYDKRLYDRLEHGNARSVRLHLSADLAFQAKLLRFLENHDEPRAAAAFALEREEAAAVVTATLPGARLFHEGQFEGRRVRLPVFLRRRPEEPVNRSLQVFYKKLLESIDRPTFREGEWSVSARVGRTTQAVRIFWLGVGGKRENCISSRSILTIKRYKRALPSHGRNSVADSMFSPTFFPAHVMSARVTNLCVRDSTWNCGLGDTTSCFVVASTPQVERDCKCLREVAEGVSHEGPGTEIRSYTLCGLHGAEAPE